MADQKINELPTKTAPSTGDKMLMIGAAEEYQIDYDKLASAILDKLATKQYSELDTTAKTVLGALDELNSKNVFAGTAIQSGDDLNDYTTPGIYYSPASAVSGTLINIPDESAKTSGFSLLVLPMSVSVSGSRVSQIIIRGSEASTIYTRSESSSGWRSWYKYAGEQLPD